MKLYTFSKQSWHVKFYAWLFGKNPVYIYKTMCPYFWTYVVILLTLPFILIAKMFGRYGTQFLNWTKDYRLNKKRKTIAHLKTICSDVNLTQKEAYKIVNSKCWENHRWDIPNDVRMNVRNLAHKYDEQLISIRIEKRAAKLQRHNHIQKQYEEYKEAKWFTPISYIVSFAVICTVVFTLGYSLYKGAQMVNWDRVWQIALLVLVILGSSAVVIGLGYVLIKYAIVPSYQWITCVKLPNCGICNNFKKVFSYLIYLWMPIKWVILGIVKIFAIIGNMIYSTYKKQCPMITWED